MIKEPLNPNLSKKKKGKSSNRGNSRISLVGCSLVSCPKLPPDFNNAPVRRIRRRFVQNAAVVNQAFTLANGHDQFLVVTNAATGAAVPFVDCWRIRKISVWMSSDGALPASFTLTPTGADIDSNMYNDKEQVFGCTSRSTAEPAHMSILTPPDKPIGSWHFTSNTNFAGTLFQVNITNHGSGTNYRATLDIEFDYVENWVGLPLGYGIVTATTTLGTVGARGILGGFQPININNLG